MIAKVEFCLKFLSNNSIYRIVNQSKYIRNDQVYVVFNQTTL